MIAVLTKCTIYEDYDHDRSHHRNVMFLVFIGLLPYRFIHKNVLYLSLYKGCDTMIAVSQSVIFLSQCSQRTVITNRNPHTSIVIISAPLSTDIK